MNFYPVLENIVVALLTVASLYFALRLAMPSAVRRAQSLIAQQMERSGRPSWLRALGRRLAPHAVSGCAVGCGSACNGCGSATQTTQAISLPATRRDSGAI